MLEILAMFTMLIDHIGAVFFPDIGAYRMIGRLSMPLYTYGIVQGFRHSRHRGRYALRLLAIATVSQPFFALIWPGELNIVFAFSAGLLTLYALEQAPAWADRLSGLAKTAGDVFFRPLILLFAALGFTLIPMDYGLYTLLLLLLYRYGRSWSVLLGGHFTLNLVATPWLGPIQHLSILGTILIILPFNFPRLTTKRWFYRAFYPAHLAIIVLLSLYY